MVQRICNRKQKHPKLVSQDVKEYPDGSKVLEVFAYYKDNT